MLDGVPATLPALLRAERLGEKASRVGFDWSDARAVLAKVREEVGELEEALAGGDATRVEDELGDCLFALVSLGRKAEVSAEIALRGTLVRFQERFTRIEERLRAEGKDIHTASLAELEELWRRAKAG